MRRLLSREFWFIFVPAVALALAASWLALQYMQPAPPKSFVIATASDGAPYDELAKIFKKYIDKNGVTVELRRTDGTFENLKLLADPNSNVQAALIQGGITNKSNAPYLTSLGRLLAEPVWVFYAGSERMDRLTQLKGKRILVGPDGGGTNFMALKLLEANGITAQNSTLITLSLPDYVDALANNKADAGFLVLGAEAKTIQRLLYTPNVHLMSMVQADGLIQRFPYLNKLTLHQGVVDFGQNIPPEDTVLISTKAALVVRDDLHPALVNLLAQAVYNTQIQPPSGNFKLFPIPSEQLLDDDPEFLVASEAKLVYKSGPPFLQRLLPFWLATLANRAFVLLLPLLGVILPLVRLVPILYNWRMKRRILYWYQQLKYLERDLPPSASPEVVEQKQQELTRIEEGVRKIAVPVRFMADLYNLRDHVDFVRKRIMHLEEKGSAYRTPQVSPVV